MAVDFKKYRRKQLALDDFNRANGNLTTPWTQFNSNWGNVTIDANEVRGSASASGGNATTTGMARFTGRTWHKDQYAEIELVDFAFQSNSYHIGPLVRGSSAHPTETCYWAFVDSDAAGPNYGTRFGKTVNGTDTVWTDKDLPWASGDTIGLEVIGNELRVLKNGDYIDDPDFYRVDNDLNQGEPGIIAAGGSAIATGDNWHAGEMVSVEPEHKLIWLPGLRTKQPARPAKIDVMHPLRPLWAIVPGWYSNDWTGADAFSSSDPVGQIESVAGSHNNRVIMRDESVRASSTSAWARTKTRTYRDLGKLRVVDLEAIGGTAGVRFQRGTGDTWPYFPNPFNLTLVALAYFKGDGRGGGSVDPRIFTKDIGTAEGDHDIMVGTASTGNEARARIRWNGTTQTLLTTGSAIDDDSVNLIAVTLHEKGTNCDGYCHHIGGARGAYSRSAVTAAAHGGVGYDPRTTTGTSIGATWGAGDNEFDGEVIMVAAFNKVLTEVDFRSLFRNPWQIFEPEPVPMLVKPDKRLVTFR